MCFLRFFLVFAILFNIKYTQALANVVKLKSEPSAHACFPEKKFRILAIDGGGVRGVVAARIIKELEQNLKKPVSEVFDLIVGTSTGGIIALGLTIPDQAFKPRYSAEDIIDIYKFFAQNFFKNSFWHRVKTGWGLFGPKYDRSSMDKFFEKIFMHIRMSDLLTNVLVLSFSLDSSLPHNWSSWIARNDIARDYFIKDIAAATSAAPTYFSPKRFTNIAGTAVKNDIDGGIFANTPIMAGILEAFRIARRNNYKLNLSDIIIVSVGTGRTQILQSIDYLKNTGIIGWLLKAKLIDVMISASSEFDDSLAQEILNEDSYYRFQLGLREEISRMDDIDENHIKEMISRAETYSIKNRENIKKLAQKLACQKEKFFPILLKKCEFSN